MKKLISVMLVLFMVLAFAGCGSDADKTVDLAAVMNDINSAYPNSMTQIETTEKLETYYMISPEDVEAFAAEFDQTGIDEIILVKAANADAVSKIETALTNRYNAKLQLGASYSPEQLEIMKGCKVATNGNYVSLIVSEKAQELTEIYDNALA